MNDPDAALMLEFAHGDEEAFVKLYRSYRDRMVGYCMRLLGDLAQAEEAAQDVFLKLYGARASYQPQSRFSTYLYRIATHHCWNLRARLDRTLVKRGVAVEEHADAARGTSDPTERIAND
ncbi:MAG TPA: sigma-70 family RNA polymerase sigma factor, partial [Polyangiales bacterium]|nr:sigma-70 family RNA polymerase sigma factor [Polyangiales bacterium]